ncbi:class I SAM-dependent DNA methyltransferase [Mesobacillus harenae]|uniref:class I SAM-dependent DNA methyltransferase n=1 Tax=Mesobacillus harenae TaxID=2213203 RepID=UPI00157FC582|nr:class I SAM-dependent methyltransferase [Mesobacillus harenae]
MSYGGFANLYDTLMQDIPYDDWVSLVMKQLETYQITGGRLMDLACGTGELSIRFAQAGFDVTGIDLSGDMLAIAQSKTADHNLSVQYFQQNMAELEGFDEHDIIGIFCDSLNYLEKESDIVSTFNGVFRHLRDDGLFIFDVHSLYKMNHIFMDETFTMKDENISYIWDCFPGVEPDSVEHDLSFFALDSSTGKYSRIDELHFQRTFSVERYSNWLEQAGFKVLEISADFESKVPEPDSERIFITARKSKAK